MTAKRTIAERVVKRAVMMKRQEYYKSYENVLRSMNVYYSYDVMSKRKYIQILKANKCMNVANFVTYTRLSEHINNIDIGVLTDIDSLHHADGDEKAVGFCRNLIEFVPRLAQFYLCVYKQRADELIQFHNKPKKNADSTLFLMCIGGDEAPESGMAYLISFMNVGKRIASSTENHLIFGGDVKEDSLVVRAYVSKLMTELRYLESRVFYVSVDGIDMPVEFGMGGLPNDMKHLAFLEGALSNAAKFFCTYANVNSTNNTNPDFTFGEPDSQWKPFPYDQRVSVAAAVEAKKQKLEATGKSAKSQRTELTKFIASKDSRQEFVPLVNEYIDLATCEPLHLKNNVCKEQFMKLLNLCLANANITSKSILFKELPVDNLFVAFLEFVRSDMNYNYLQKKVITWFNESRFTNEKVFGFRFRGKESFSFLRTFPQLIFMLKSKMSSTYHSRLVEVFYQCIHLRRLVSYSARITDISADDIKEMHKAGRNLFRSQCFYDSSVTPSLWSLCNAAPAHSKQLLNAYGFGLSIFTMEGREQKHQIIKKYSAKSTFQHRWSSTFRHDYIQNIFLREKGFDQRRYTSPQNRYIPHHEDGHCCTCCLPLTSGLCDMCNSDAMQSICAKVEHRVQMECE